jgi:hypothetical protein
VRVRTEIDVARLGAATQSNGYRAGVIRRWQLALTFVALLASYLVIRVVQGEPQTTVRGVVAWGVAFVVSVLVLLCTVLAGRRR